MSPGPGIVDEEAEPTFLADEVDPPVASPIAARLLRPRALRPWHLCGGSGGALGELVEAGDVASRAVASSPDAKVHRQVGIAHVNGEARRPDEAPSATVPFDVAK